MSKYTMNGNINGNIKTESSSSNLSNRLDKIFKNKVRNNFKNIEPLQNIYTEPTKVGSEIKTNTNTKEGFQDTANEVKKEKEKVKGYFQLKKINNGDLKKKEGWHSLFYNIFYAFPGLLNYFSHKIVNAGDKGHREHDRKWIKESMVEFCTIFLAIYFAGAMYHKLVIKPQGPIKEYIQTDNKDLNYYLNEWIFIFLLLLPDVFHFIVYDGIKKNIVNKITERPTICYLLFYMLSFFFCTFFLQNIAELFLDMILFKTNPVIYLFITLGFFRWVLNMPLKSKVQAMGSSILFLIYLILHFVISMMLGPIAQGAFSIYVMMFFSGGYKYVTEELPKMLKFDDTVVSEALKKSAMPDGTFLGMFDYYIHRFIFRSTPLMLTFILTVFFAYKLIFGLVPPIGLKGRMRMIIFAIVNGLALLTMMGFYYSSFNYKKTNDSYEMVIRGKNILNDDSGNNYVKDPKNPDLKIYKEDAIKKFKSQRRDIEKNKMTKELESFIQKFNNGTIKIRKSLNNKEPLNTNMYLEEKYKNLKKRIEDGDDMHKAINEIKDYSKVRNLIYLTGFSVDNTKENNEYNINNNANNYDVNQHVKFDVDKHVRSLKNIYNNKKISYSYRQIAYVWAKEHFMSTIQMDKNLEEIYGEEDKEKKENYEYWKKIIIDAYNKANSIEDVKNNIKKIINEIVADTEGYTKHNKEELLLMLKEENYEYWKKTIIDAYSNDTFNSKINTFISEIGSDEHLIEHNKEELLLMLKKKNYEYWKKIIIDAYNDNNKTISDETKKFISKIESDKNLTEPSKKELLWMLNDSSPYIESKYNEDEKNKVKKLKYEQFNNNDDALQKELIDIKVMLRNDIKSTDNKEKENEILMLIDKLYNKMSEINITSVSKEQFLIGIYSNINRHPLINKIKLNKDKEEKNITPLEIYEIEKMLNINSASDLDINNRINTIISELKKN